jgi:hypothetical protein
MTASFTEENIVTLFDKSLSKFDSNSPFKDALISTPVTVFIVAF